MQWEVLVKMLSPEDNQLRGIGHLAVLDGWFKQASENKNRYVFHLDVSFRNERLGGEEGSEVRFRIVLKQCEIVVQLPNKGQGFDIDPVTLARTDAGAMVKVTDIQTSKTDISGDAEVAAGLKGVGGGLRAKVMGRKIVTRETDQSEELPRLIAQHSRSIDNDPSWIITSPLKILDGVLWNAVEEPRFTVIDTRDESQIKKDRATSIPPLALVYVRCKREDLQIDDIVFKDSVSNEEQKRRRGYEARLRTAEAYLKAEIQRQNLKVDNVHDAFSEMTLAEYVVPLFK